MQQLLCPRCHKPFEYSARFCDKCGFKKGKTFSKRLWWWIALLVDLLLVVLLATFWRPINALMGHASTLSDDTVTPVFVIFAMFILLPTMCIYKIHCALWLRKYGKVASGRVVKHEQGHSPKGGMYIISTVKFMPVTQSAGCYVRYSGWRGSLPSNKRVKVLYDPYNPGGLAQVDPGLEEVIGYTLLALISAMMPALMLAILFTS